MSRLLVFCLYDLTVISKVASPGQHNSFKQSLAESEDSIPNPCQISETHELQSVKQIAGGRG